MKLVKKPLQEIVSGLASEYAQRFRVHDVLFKSIPNHLRPHSGVANPPRSPRKQRAMDTMYYPRVFIL
jgi:hypothetical protein